MKFHEFSPGQHFELGPVVMTEEAIVRFARDWDPQSFHIDKAAAEAGRWKGLIASGWHTAGTAMRLVVDGPLKDSDSIGSPGLAYLKWLAPVRPDDAIRVRLEVLETSVSKSGKVGALRWRWQVVNQHDTVVLDTEATSLFQLIADPG
jgi:acyl dehydratase